MSQFYDAFISYGRADSKQFTKSLYDRLTSQGYSVWFDFEDIPLGVDYQKQIDDGIIKAHNFIFIIAPHSVNSPYCQLEIELALKLNKRIIPVLHVEEVTQEIWQSRNPQANPNSWEIFCQEGKHSSFINLHPTLSKINWVYGRENQETLDQVLAGVTEIFHRQQTYVETHTALLEQAIHWEKSNHREQYLLQGEPLQAAKDWLDIRFVQEQPPCVPTDLHCEYIAESLYLAQGGATRAFLSHSDRDDQITEMIRRSILREGMPVWIDRSHIQTGADFQQSINRGIELADTLVYLISPNSIRSSYCQQEFAYARQLHKRIIPLLVDDLPVDLVPPDQRALQFIDCQNYQDPEVFQKAISKLIQTLKRHEVYDHWHKTLLVQALHWDSQERPKSLLLRADELAVAEHWIQQSAHQEDLAALVLIQEDYISASREKNKFFDAFISYGRPDSKDFAFKLHDQLTAAGYRVWFDQNDIPLGVDFQDQINDGLEKSDNFLYIISPHAVNSPYCGKEIELAVQRNKRLIPVLHVEKITYETWKQRNPNGTPDQWEAYQEAGKDSSFPNMHPAIGKVNWVYMREGMDDWDQSFQGLCNLLERDREYVHNHTDILAKALEWERNQYQTSYLLTGDDRKNATAWIQTRFRDRQAPCIPTDLHCEYICESNRNTNNLMTEVFMVYGESQEAMATKLRRTLMRQGITVWVNRGEVKGTEERQEQINQAIIEADNIIVLLDEESFGSAEYRESITHAQTLNKRLIPLKVTPLVGMDLPGGIRNWPVIDFTHEEHSPEYPKAEVQLIQTLQTDAIYYAQHKILLVQALKWEQQKHNPSILLRGYGLRQMESWYQIAQQRKDNIMLPVQWEFLEASRHEPPNQTFNVFISYSRADSDFARKINENLQIQGMITWFDQENIETGEDFQAAIYQGITNSENFLFIISPNAVLSPYAANEIEYATKLNKRFVAVLYREVPPSALHPSIVNVQWIDFRRRGGDFLANFGDLVRVLVSDPAHVQIHTRLLVKAGEWEQSGRDDSFLLRGKDLSQGLEWLAQAENKTPVPTPLHRAYVEASRSLPRRHLKPRTLVWSSLAATVAVFMVRLLGATESAELRMFDVLVRLRPPEPQDERVTVIEVDPASTRWLRQKLIQGEYEPGLGTIPDAALEQILGTLAAYDPAVVALDFYRDFKAEPVVADRLKTMDNLVTVCKAESEGADGEMVDGYTPPPEIDPSQWSERVGFSDLSEDGEKLIRRHYLLKIPDPKFCDRDQSFSLMVARRFLAAQGNTSFQSALTQQENGSWAVVQDLRLGDLTIPRLAGGQGSGYQYSFRLEGYQALVNWRQSFDPQRPDRPPSGESFARKMSLQTLLEGSLAPEQMDELVRGRMVFIGFTDRADPTSDFWTTPLGEMPGVYIQAQLASQLVSAVEDDRPLLQWWNLGLETLWIWVWGAVGGSILWRLFHPTHWLGAGVGAIVVLVGICYGALVAQGLWLPIVPAIIAMGLTAMVIAVLNYRLRNPR